MEDCIFCRIRDGEVPSPKLYEDEYCFAILDIHPQAKAHLLFISKAHLEDAAHAAYESPGTLERILGAAARFARHQDLEEGGYRLVTNVGAHARQSVRHLHIHLLGGEPLCEHMGADPS